jgi:hypothetical protein
MASGDLCLIMLQLSVSGNMSEWHSLTVGHTTARVSRPSGHQTEHYVGIHDCLGSAPGLTHTGSGKGPLSLQFESPEGTNKLEVVRQHPRDRKEPDGETGVS